jgi:hypothetical protein
MDPAAGPTDGTATADAAGTDVPEPAGASGAKPLIAADVGQVFTRVFLFEDVEGERRLVAAGQAPTLGDDGLPAPRAALAQALAQALAYAGRSGAPADGERLLVSSAGTPPRLLIVARGPDDARAVAGALAHLPLHLLEPFYITGSASDPERLLAEIDEFAPDIVVLAGPARGAPGGDDGGRTPSRIALEAVAYGYSGHRPQIVLAGGQAAGGDLAALLATAPQATVAEGIQQLGRVVPDILGRVSAGHPQWDLLEPGALADWQGDGAPASSLQGICTATEVIADRYDIDVLTLDLGAGHAMAVAVTGTAGQRRAVAAVRDDLGARLGRWHILRTAGAAAVNRWLPNDLDEPTLQAACRRAAALPAGVPETVEELLLEHAFARESLGLVLHDLARAFERGGVSGGGWPQVDLVIGSGGVLAGAPRLMQAVLILLDAVQPRFLTQLALDRTAALAVLGEVVRRSGPGALGSALERDGLLNLGLCIAPVGSGREGETAVKVEVVTGDRSPMTVEVAFGAIEVIPLTSGERAALKLWPGPDFDVGLGKGNAATPRADVEGGAVGIIVDARGRPLPLPDGPHGASKRQAKLLQWLQATRAYPQLSFVQPTALEEGGTP